MKVALVYDRVTKFGGAERVLLALHEIWPDAPLFTPVYNADGASYARVFDVRSSLLSKWPLNYIPHEILPPILPLVYEAMNFDSYDVVITITSAEAKGILTKPNTLHVCYCLTPTRYLWSGYEEYRTQPGLGFINPLARIFFQTGVVSLRMWDSIASSRPDIYLAISQTVRDRIWTYYRRLSEVIYPPIDVDTFIPAKPQREGTYFLIVSRLVPYKRIDYAIEAFNALGIVLKVIGSGIDERRLRNRARRNIEFIGNDLTDTKLCWYYQNCKALIYPGEEDFGMTAIEAQACGKPVIAYRGGGVAETLIPGKTGELYSEKSAPSLYGTVLAFDAKEYLPKVCRTHACRFSKDRFKKLFRIAIEKYWSKTYNI